MDQISFMQECHNCAYPTGGQTYLNAVVEFEKPEENFWMRGNCVGGAQVIGDVKPLDDTKKSWIIPQVDLPPMTGAAY